jgi:uracil-DNA glycosylase
VLLWNLVPTHPAGPVPHSNRRPSRDELEAGAGFLRRLLDGVRPAHVVAIGRLAAAALGEDVPCVRHPANGGATACRAGLGALLEEWLGRPIRGGAGSVDAAGRSAIPSTDFLLVE